MYLLLERTPGGPHDHLSELRTTARTGPNILFDSLRPECPAATLRQPRLPHIDDCHSHARSDHIRLLHGHSSRPTLNSQSYFISLANPSFIATTHRGSRLNEFLRHRLCLLYIAAGSFRLSRKRGKRELFFILLADDTSNNFRNRVSRFNWVLAVLPCPVL